MKVMESPSVTVTSRGPSDIDLKIGVAENIICLIEKHGNGKQNFLMTLKDVNIEIYNTHCIIYTIIYYFVPLSLTITARVRFEGVNLFYLFNFEEKEE